MSMMTSHASAQRIPRSDGPEDAPAQEASGDIRYRQDAANYIAAMLAELRQIAGKAGFDRLVKSLDTAYYEAYGARDGRLPDAAPVPAEAPHEKISKSMEPNRT